VNELVSTTGTLMIKVSARFGVNLLVCKDMYLRLYVSCLGGSESAGCINKCNRTHGGVIFIHEVLSVKVNKHRSYMRTD